MPAVSAKQKKFMDAAAHNPEFAKKTGIPVGVAQEFSAASKGQKIGTGTRPDRQGVNKPKTDHGSMNLFKEGGVMKNDMMQDKAMAKKAIGMHESQLHGGKKSNLTKLAKGGSASSRADGCAMKGKTKGMMVKMKSGGMSC
jgi:hypothetical protein